MKERKDDYYNIGELSQSFRIFTEEMEKDPKIEWSPTQLILMWQIRTQLAIAQQVSMVAKHLGEIVRKSKETVNNDQN
jgi:hypothetical protein